MFNFGLYKEGLRKLQTVGIIYAVIMVIAGLMIPIINVYNFEATRRRAIENNWYWFDYSAGIQVNSNMIMFIIFAAIFAPLLVWGVFGFLNERSSSDYFHAIPQKRQVLFSSFFAAALTWVLSFALIHLVLVLGILSTNEFSVFYWTDILSTVGGIFTVLLLISTSVTLAMSVTGNWLTNIIATSLILFFPRGIMVAFIQFLITTTFVIDETNFGFFGNNHLNLLISVFDSSPNPHLLISIIYTSILALVYFLIAVYLFKIRDSEIAGNPGSNWSQSLMRILVGFIATIPGIILIAGPRWNREWLTVIVWYIVVIFGYFIYEFITARKILQFKRMMHGLLIITVLNVISILSLNIIRNSFFQEINRERVVSVVIDDFNIRNRNWNNSYILSQMNGLEISDIDVAQSLADDLNSDINQYGNRGQGPIRATFTLLNGRSVTRRINHNFNTEFTNWLMNYEPYQLLYTNIPSNFDSIWSDHDLSEAQQKRVLNILEEEIRELPFEEWYPIVGTFVNDVWIYIEETNEWIAPHGFREYGAISIGLINDGFWHYSQRFPITELTPRALELYLEYARLAR